jgi:hypothetical protein
VGERGVQVRVVVVFVEVVVVVVVVVSKKLCALQSLTEVPLSIMVMENLSGEGGGDCVGDGGGKSLLIASFTLVHPAIQNCFSHRERGNQAADLTLR